MVVSCGIAIIVSRPYGIGITGPRIIFQVLAQCAESSIRDEEKEVETMRLEICCKDMLEEWNNGNINLCENGEVEWMDMGDVRFCPFCGEKFDYEITIKNKGVE